MRASPSATLLPSPSSPVQAAFFFVTALFVMLWLVAPVTLAVVYGHYAKVSCWLAGWLA